jgi:hypothetical protein
MFESFFRRRILSLALGASLLLTLASTGCVVHHHHTGGSVQVVEAPPLSPADGYVHSYYGAVLVFDRSWNGYWVRDYSHHYFYRDHYYRWDNGHWQRASRIGGPWLSVDRLALPPGLHQREVAHERRDERREAVKEQREDRREAVQERREERREAVQEHQKEQREAAQERREDRREAVQERRDERREAVQERREERREVSQSGRDSGKAERSSGPGRGSKAHRKANPPDAADEEIPANQEVR